MWTVPERSSSTATASGGTEMCNATPSASMWIRKSKKGQQGLLPLGQSDDRLDLTGPVADGKGELCGREADGGRAGVVEKLPPLGQLVPGRRFAQAAGDRTLHATRLGGPGPEAWWPRDDVSDGRAASSGDRPAVPRRLHGPLRCGRELPLRQAVRASVVQQRAGGRGVDSGGAGTVGDAGTTAKATGRQGTRLEGEFDSWR